MLFLLFCMLVTIRMKNNNESAISLLFVSLYIDRNFISYTFTFSSSLLSSINFVPSSERYKLQNRFCVFVFLFFFFVFCFCDYSIKPIKQCFYNVFNNIVIMYFRVLKFTVILSIFQCFFILKKTNFWNAALYDVIDDVHALVSKTCTSSRTSAL